MLHLYAMVKQVFKKGNYELIETIPIREYSPCMIKL